MGWRKPKQRTRVYKKPKHLRFGKNTEYPQSIYYHKSKNKKRNMNLQDLQKQTAKPTFWQSSIRPYPIFFFAVFFLAPILYFSPHGIKEVTEHNKGTVWPLVFSIIIWGFIVIGIIWFWFNHVRVVRIWKREQKLKG